MSTTLVPPSYYVVKPPGQTARVFPTLAQAATALSMLAGSGASIGVITGSRVRALNQMETRDLRRMMRASQHSGLEAAWPGPLPANKLDSSQPTGVPATR